MSDELKGNEALEYAASEDDPAMAEFRAMVAESRAHAEKRGEWKERAVEIGFQYWRAPDSHGVVATTAQAIELLQELLGVEVEIKDVDGERQP
ncbi:hypothetical protein QYH69_32400 [Paraburkholderia sp. SARCC-3016]|uniref:hypothetical protein n=1 Tax=Paraburkholderia sp. SARCC-3016 TaxID=3058611 RepID=UPI0028092AEC|nr:hypothetical protein [Paraburkholderia sp. SARCC-3016]MDQ7981926.1 hypothetical protein [Paraburkholderia sp. SARCC-3016]